MNTEYSHIDTIYKRFTEGPMKGKLIIGEFSQPEFVYLSNNTWVGTEKVDGTNIRVMWDALNADKRPPVQFGGKTNNAQISTALISRLRELFDSVDIDSALPKIGDAHITLYGEGYGAKIQKGGGNYKADGVDFVLFDVKVGNWWLQRDALEEIASILGIRIVPIVFTGTLAQACGLTNAGYESLWGKFQAEGLVLKPAIDLVSRKGDRIITKIKTKDFR